ncbi:MAG: sugar ABC transporter substrate-binding protein [Candidatus Omnitrophica bacterium]|nr:sugar ABC transporter substrate-binding protein [Candidatus Omnitrophota bacterium]
MKNTSINLQISTLIFIFFLIITGCSRKTEDRGITTLNFIALATPDNVKITDFLIKKFEESRKGVNIKVEYVPGSELRNKILIRTTGGVPLDAVHLNDTAFPDFVRKGVFYPLDEFAENDPDFHPDDFHPSAIECAKIEGKLYSLPPIFGTVVCFYNRTLFDKAGIPYPQDGWTWDEFRSVCKGLTIDENKDGKPEQFGCSVIGFWEWTPMLFQNGGRVLDENGRCVFNSAQNIETLQFVKDMYTKDKTLVSQGTFPGAFSGGNMAMDMGELFGTGKIGLQFGGLELIDKFPKGLDWDMVSPPVKDGGAKYFHGGFWGYAVTSNSGNKKLAWEFIKFLVSKPQLEEVTEGVKVKRWAPMGPPSIPSLQKDFLTSLYPGKHIDSYLYCLKYPEFGLAHAWTNAVFDEIAKKYNIQENLMGITQDDLKALMDNFTRDANEKLGL